jgi:hypothetical protein
VLPALSDGTQDAGRRFLPDRDIASDNAGARKISRRPSSVNIILCPSFLAQRAFTAFLALALRCSGVILAARALPPFKPPFWPIFDRYSRNSGGSFLAMPRSYTKPAQVASMMNPIELREPLTYNSAIEAKHR